MGLRRGARDARIDARRGGMRGGRAEEEETRAKAREERSDVERRWVLRVTTRGTMPIPSSRKESTKLEPRKERKSGWRVLTA